MSTNLSNCLPPNSIVLDAAFYRTVNAKGCSVIMFISVCPKIIFLKFLLGSVFPHKTIVFKCRSGSSCSSRCESGSWSRDPNHCGSGSWSDFNVTKSQNFAWKILLKIGFRSKNIHKQVQMPFWKAGNQIYLLILVNFHTLGSGSASRTSRSMRIRIHTTLIKT